MQFGLDEPFKLAIESEDGKNLRLVVLTGDEEWVCHKTNGKTLKKFLTEPDSTLFKGRLQLHKMNDHITVLVKEQAIGHILVVDFEAVLHKL
ncbi:hypothetical protein VRU48_04910 [Pedobacter sp. KR3-3]|uniref:Uncharacterized protein n=1 Tax=Pedobacter albus TaxID=3113905 RepID=A0ABU7I4W5_9SPHI|nr:hypothetical protein [Pedobacter sp. KR3-3]MEE1944437.1 hypothetical protein [Pedobacter sp. KR3-3]